ncbi:RNA polymerase sigma factor [Streptomyces griseorubiginosus]|uniref:RNA polymerase sigma factor n=1 Tax=Streptomyces griseorubiginosus TaxID=67304 RepID=UPI003452C386
MTDDVADTQGTRGQPAKHTAVGYSYQEDKPYLIRFLLRQGADLEEAQDAVHTAYAEMLKTSETVSHPRAWLRTVALRSFLRQIVRVPEKPDQDVMERHTATVADWRTPLQAVELNEQQRLVFAALLQLPFKQRSVLAWHMDGFTTSEIADAMGLEKAAVLQNLSRARRTLKRQLGIADPRRSE